MEPNQTVRQEVIRSKALKAFVSLNLLDCDVIATSIRVFRRICCRTITNWF